MPPAPAPVLAPPAPAPAFALALAPALPAAAVAGESMLAPAFVVSFALLQPSNRVASADTGTPMQALNVSRRETRRNVRLPLAIFDLSSHHPDPTNARARAHLTATV